MLNILIPRLEKRSESFHKLHDEIIRQSKEIGREVNVNWFMDNGKLPIGYKRNSLLQDVKEGYVSFIDDDDRISPNYVRRLYDGIDRQVDCCSLVGSITVNGKNAKPFHHSIIHKKYWEDEKAYYRFPNHLNCIKAEIAKQFKFPETNHGEDTNWAYQLHNAGVLNVQHDISECIYFYDYITNK